jgi:NAD-dependent DNA ligase
MAYTVRQRIEWLRKECIINRILYYVFSRPVISDYDYDMMEKELSRLCDKFPDEATEAPYFAICPTVCCGSDLEDHYPPELVSDAKSRL